jgi:hypothetical protein
MAALSLASTRLPCLVVFLLLRLSSALLIALSLQTSLLLTVESIHELFRCLVSFPHDKGLARAS